MKITVRYATQLKQRAGTDAEELELTEAASVQACLQAVSQRHTDLQSLLLDANGSLSSTILVFVGGDQIDDPATATLKEGDVVTLLSPIAGGGDCD